MTTRWLNRILLAALLATPGPSSAVDKTTPRRALPILCARALTDGEAADIRNKALALQPRDAEVWFVAVVYVDRLCFHARVYFRPDESSPRLRKGRYARLQDWQDERGRPTRDVEIRTYAQVSPPDEPFGEALDVPQMPHIPFHWPSLAQWELEKRSRREGEERTPMSADEVVRLIDAARGARPPDAPVCTIQYEAEEDAIAVARGVSGHGGKTVFLRKQPAGDYRVVGGCGWSGGMY